MQGDHIAAFPRESAADFRQIAGRLHVISGGVRLGRLKGTTVCPCHALAMSTAFNPSACSVFSLNRAEAIRYLRKEPLVLPGALPKGYVLLTHQNYPLGFAKQLGNRANNLYPSEWRIRSNNPKDIKDGVE
jgi:NOL1/NOP2/fmu family ribosome biogenesis protein